VISFEFLAHNISDIIRGIYRKDKEFVALMKKATTPALAGGARAGATTISRSV
jgi:hypothetical protein